MVISVIASAGIVFTVVCIIFVRYRYLRRKNKQANKSIQGLEMTESSKSVTASGDESSYYNAAACPTTDSPELHVYEVLTK